VHYQLRWLALIPQCTRSRKEAHLHFLLLRPPPPPFCCSCCCCFLWGIYLFTLREKIRNCWLSIRKYPNIVECRRLLRCVGNVAVVFPDPAVTHTMKGMPSSVSPVDRDGLKSNGNHATPRFGVNTMELPVCVHAGHLCFLLPPALK
jgi:hypothetical protein